MRKLIVKDITEGKYTLQDIKTKITYEFYLTFYDIEEPVEVGDYIGFQMQLLDKRYGEYSIFYTFGGINRFEGREINLNKDTDLVFLDTKNKSYMLKRLWG